MSLSFNRQRLSEVDKQIAKLQKERDTILSNIEKEKTAFDRFLETYGGRELTSKHSLEEYGIWKVEGEDPNCDFGGSHHQPNLGLFEGKLLDVIKTAVELPAFWTWGAGGNITKVKEPAITKV